MQAHIFAGTRSAQRGPPSCSSGSGACLQSSALLPARAVPQCACALLWGRRKRSLSLPSQRLAQVSCNPAVVAGAKATLRREAAEVHALPRPSSEELLPQVHALGCVIACECFRGTVLERLSPQHQPQLHMLSPALHEMSPHCCHLLPQLESVLSFGHGGPAGGRAEEERALEWVGIEPEQAATAEPGPAGRALETRQTG